MNMYWFDFVTLKKWILERGVVKVLVKSHGCMGAREVNDYPSWMKDYHRWYSFVFNGCYYIFIINVYIYYEYMFVCFGYAEEMNIGERDGYVFLIS